MNIKNLSIGEAAARIPQATALFREYNIDFCCGGNRPLQYELDRFPELEAKLQVLLESNSSDEVAWLKQPFPELIEFILDRFHQKHRHDLPELLALSERVENRHQDNPLCPHGLTQHLLNMGQELEFHMQKEENILFPILNSDPASRPMMPIRRMMEEHEEHKLNLERLEELTHQFKLDETACPTWHALYTNLQTLINDIKEHIHLENNVLFKRALE